MRTRYVSEPFPGGMLRDIALFCPDTRAKPATGKAGLWHIRTRSDDDEIWLKMKYPEVFPIK